MKREIITTADGSKTIHLPDWNEHYHSIHGAIQEAYHVFIKHGLRYFCNQYKDLNHLSILEIGFGTGLNALITLLEAEKLNLNINYKGVEAYPVSIKEIKLLDYPEQLDCSDKQDEFNLLHESDWEEPIEINKRFTLTKQLLKFSEIRDKDKYNIIYFDAFGARVQPELWTVSIFKIMYEALKEQGVLVTYSAKGSVKRAMLEVGFNVERLQGPPGKRHMLRATK